MKKGVALIVVFIIAGIFLVWKVTNFSTKFSFGGVESNNDGIFVDTILVEYPVLMERKTQEFLKAKYVGQNTFLPISDGIVTQVYTRPSHKLLKGVSLVNIYFSEGDSLSNHITEVKSTCNCEILNDFKLREILASPSFLEIKNESALFQVAIPKILYEIHKPFYESIKGAIAAEMNDLKVFDLKDSYVSGSDIILFYAAKEAFNYSQYDVWLKVNAELGLDYHLAKSAILRKKEGDFVAKVRNNKLETVPVPVLTDSGEYYLVRGDISSTDQIVIFPADSLISKSLVYPITAIER
ncbi:MAG: hypothetical protein ACI9IP_001620 [Arcticibacterium sp.]|jgi:hypothetical protein